MPPGTKDKKKKDLSLEDIFGNGSVESAVAEPSRKSNGGTSLEDIFGNGEQSTIEKKSQVQSSDDTGIPSQDGIVDTSQSNSVSSFGIEPLKNQTENQLVPKAFQQEIPTLTPTQKAAAASLQQTKDAENDIKSWMTNPDAGTIDTNKPTTSKYNNAKAEALKALTETSNDLAIAGGKPIDVQAAINNPDQFPDVVTKIKNYYDKKIAATIDYTYDRFGEKRAGTERDNAASLALKSDRDKALKNIDLLQSIAIVNKNPDATYDAVGMEKLKLSDPIAYSNLQLAPTMTSLNYKKAQLGVEAKLAAMALKSESGNFTEDDVAKANKLINEGENLVYKYPDIRKQELRQVIMERLANSKQLGGVFSDEAAKKAMVELDKMIAKPISQNDLPLLKQMKDDLDVVPAAVIVNRKKNKLGLEEITTTDPMIAEKEKYSKEKEQYQSQDIQSTVGREFSSPFIETSKFLDRISGFRTDKKTLEEADKEATGTKNYTPKRFTFKVPDYTRDEVTGKMVANSDAGDYQLRALPYKAAGGLSNLAGQLVLGELAGAGYAATIGKAATRLGESTAGMVGRIGGGSGFAAEINVANSAGIRKSAETLNHALQMQMKIDAPSFSMSYDQNRKDAIKNFGSSPENAWKVDLASGLNSGLEALTEQIGNPYEQLDVLKSLFKKNLNETVTRNIAGLTISEVEKMGRPQWQQFIEKAAKYAIKTTGTGAKNVSGESFEEFANAIGKNGVDTMLGANMENRDALTEGVDAFIDAAASMSFLGAAGMVNGHRSYYSNSGMSQQSVFEVGSKADTYRDAILQQHSTGILTDKERDEKLNLVNSAQVAKADWDEVKQYAKPSKDETQASKKGINYVQARTNEIALQKEHDNSTNPVRQQKLAAQIKKWQNVQQALIDMPVDFNTDAVPVLPAVTSNGLVEVRAPNMDEVPVELQAQAVETVNQNGVPEVVFFVPNQDAANPVVTPEEKTEEPAVKLNEIFDVPVIYKGQRGVISREGQVAVFKPEGQERLIELGTIDDTENTVGIGNQSISDFDIEQEKSVVLSNDKGNIVVRGKEYVNNYSNPEAAITRDADGNIQSVSLETVGGAKRNFRGREAEDIAYQIKLKVQDRQNKAKQLAQLAAERDRANQEIQTAYQDNVQEPDAWVKPYEAARTAQDEAVKNLATAPTTETTTESKTQNEELARKLGSIRNDDFMRQYFNEEDNAAYEKADEEGKADLIKSKKEQLLSSIKTEVSNAIQEQTATSGVLRNEGIPREGELQGMVSDDQSESTTQESGPTENQKEVALTPSKTDNTVVGKTEKTTENENTKSDSVSQTENGAVSSEGTKSTVNENDAQDGKGSNDKVVGNETKTTKAEDIKPAEETVIADKEADTDSGSTEKSTSQKAKELADRIRQLRPKSGSAQSNILAIPLAIYDTAIVAVANIVELGGTIAEGIQAGIQAIRDGLNDQGWKDAGNSFANHINDFLGGKDITRNVVLGDVKVEKTKDEAVREILERELNPKDFPTLFNAGGNLTLKQEAAVTQGEGQQREVDGPYVVALENDLRQTSLSNAALLQELLGDDWAAQTVDYIERNPNGGNIANIVGVLNVISTDTYNKIAQAKTSSDLNALKAFQNRTDKVAIQSARRASLALNMRRLYAKFAMGESIGSIMADRVLNENEKEFLTALEQALVAPVTEAEINAVPDTPKPSTAKRKQQRKTESQKRQKKTSRGKSKSQADEIISNASIAAERVDDSGTKRKMSWKELAAIAKEKINKIKC